MKHLIFGLALVLAMPACRYGWVRQEADVRQEVYYFNKTSAKVIRAVHGEPDRIEVAPVSDVRSFSNRKVRTILRARETWYYDDLGKWFQIQRGRVVGWGDI